MSEVVCPDDELLSRYAWGSLEPIAADGVGGHLEQCTRCQDRMNVLERGGDALLLHIKDVPSVVDAAMLAEHEFVRACDASRRLSEDFSGGDFSRYRIDEQLGEGGFGSVYRAFDERLDRWVVLKIARERAAAEDLTFLEEARIAARLEHPRIVPVYDAGCTEDGRHYIVFKTVDATSLRDRMRTDSFDPPEVARIIRDVALVLQFAHENGVVHRDIKPSNILLDRARNCFVADFGLALTEDQFGFGPRFAGTPEYMSPEQARGEGHRVDGRSDIFNLGVVLYEFLTGRRPFHGSTRDELLDQITNSEARPLRQWDVRIPRELERICLKALSARMADRYATAKDMADELDRYLAECLSSTEPVAAIANDTRTSPRVTTIETEEQGSTRSEAIHVVPKGLRSFGPEDTEFFPFLLPGARDRHGEPESLRFWRRRIDTAGPSDSFTVGVLYGPSGCGKSSFVKAGLIPRLSRSIVTIYLEATSENFEIAALARIKRQFPDLADSPDLVSAIAALRHGWGLAHGQKVLLVIDQFEQYLHGCIRYEESPLAAALRQCDGERIQTLLLVRVDFWMALKRFMNVLEISLRDGENTAAMDLFDKRHAARVLEAFGRAYQALPDSRIDTTQAEFIERAVEEMSEEGYVICVRLALFAQIVRNKPWATETLSKLGGIEGTGIAFLEDSFSDRSARPEYRIHAEAARRVLQSLLPEPGTAIKGHCRSLSDLVTASTYRAGSMEFKELMQILESELRLITPAIRHEAEDSHRESNNGASGHPYQLTHDYLVQPIRQWLTRKQRETRRGRAKLLLQELGAIWRRNPVRRNLPSLWEWFVLTLFTARQERTADESRMIKSATKRYVPLIAGVVVCCVVPVLGVNQYIQYSRANAANLVHSVLTGSPDSVEIAIHELKNHQEWVVPILTNLANDPKLGLRVRAGFALNLLEGQYDQFLIDSVPMLQPGDFEFMGSWLSSQRPPSEREDILSRIKVDRNFDNAVRWSTILLEMNDPRGVEFCLHLGPDRNLRAAFIDTFPRFGTSPDKLATWLPASDPSVQSGMCLAIGNVSRVDIEDRQATASILRSLYLSEDAGVHAAAAWALGKLKFELPERRIPQSGGWFINQSGMEFALIHPGSFRMSAVSKRVTRTDLSSNAYLVPVPKRVEIKRPFFMATHEVTVGVYREFLKSTNDWLMSGTAEPLAGQLSRTDSDWEHVIPTTPFKTDDRPIGNVSWFDAMLFCNWLSQKEGRTPCYSVPGPDWNYVTDLESWKLVRCDFEADGYRLPTDAEWEYCCRAGADSEFFFGDDLSHLSNYAVYQSHENLPVGSKMPNPWGLFDMHGNIAEWCNDWGSPRTSDWVIDPRGPDEPRDPDYIQDASQPPQKLFRGSFHSVPDPFWMSGIIAVKHLLPHGQDALIGFRVVCSTAEPRASRR